MLISWHWFQPNFGQPLESAQQGEWPACNLAWRFLILIILINYGMQSLNCCAYVVAECRAGTVSCSKAVDRAGGQDNGFSA